MRVLFERAQGSWLTAKMASHGSNPSLLEYTAMSPASFFRERKSSTSRPLTFPISLACPVRIGSASGVGGVSLFTLKARDGVRAVSHPHAD